MILRESLPLSSIRSFKIFWQSVKDFSISSEEDSLPFLFPFSFLLIFSLDLSAVLSFEDSEIKQLAFISFSSFISRHKSLSEFSSMILLKSKILGKNSSNWELNCSCEIFRSSDFSSEFLIVDISE